MDLSTRKYSSSSLPTNQTKGETMYNYSTFIDTLISAAAKVSDDPYVADSLSERGAVFGDILQDAPSDPYRAGLSLPILSSDKEERRIPTVDEKSSPPLDLVVSSGDCIQEKVSSNPLMHVISDTEEKEETESQRALCYSPVNFDSLEVVAGPSGSAFDLKCGSLAATSHSTLRSKSKESTAASSVETDSTHPIFDEPIGLGGLLQQTDNHSPQPEPSLGFRTQKAIHKIFNDCTNTFFWIDYSTSENVAKLPTDQLLVVTSMLSADSLKNKIQSLGGALSYFKQSEVIECVFLLQMCGTWEPLQHCPFSALINFNSETTFFKMKRQPSLTLLSSNRLNYVDSLTQTVEIFVSTKKFLKLFKFPDTIQITWLLSYLISCMFVSRPNPSQVTSINSFLVYKSLLVKMGFMLPTKMDILDIVPSSCKLWIGHLKNLIHVAEIDTYRIFNPILDFPANPLEHCCLVSMASVHQVFCHLPVDDRSPLSMSAALDLFVKFNYSMMTIDINNLKSDTLRLSRQLSCETKLNAKTLNKLKLIEQQMNT